MGGSRRGSRGGGGAHTLVGGGDSDFGSICSANFLRGLGGHVPPSPPGSAPGSRHYWVKFLRHKHTQIHTLIYPEIYRQKNSINELTQGR